MIIYVEVRGCDDSTSVQVEATEDEHEFLKRLAEKITETSSYSCMPTMNVFLNSEEIE